MSASGNLLYTFVLRNSLAALLVFSAVLSAQTVAFQSLFQQATDEMRHGQLDAAVSDFEKCIAADPSFPQTYLNLGLIRFQQNRFDEAATNLQKALRLKPGLRGADLFLGISDYRLDHYQEGIAALKKAVQLEPSNADGFMWLGLSEFADNDVPSAIADLEKASKLKPNDVDILYHLGRAYMQLSKDTYERMYQIDPKSWRVHQVLAESFKEADRLDDAVKECQIALSIKPAEAGLHQLLGEIYQAQNNLESAQAEFQKELNIDPENLSAMYKLATIDIERSQPEVATGLLKQVLREHPESREARFQLGRAEAQIGDTDGAIRDLSAVTKETGPIDPEALRQCYYQLSQVYRHAQRLEESRVALNTFARLKQEADAEQTRKLEDKLKRSTDQPQ